ncbi:MAG: S-methyl-5-thioribose-1-phosphate isomerase [Candidatus Thermoplasmatota archaeon]|nr:S-methyl-5-thioribose-1-phosphate isomerase [Candidatus Thermoplasmatota archaeon]
MKVKIRGKVKELRAVWLENGKVKMIDQRALPHKFKIFTAMSYKDIIFAINEMIVRGAPALGAIAACALAQASLSNENIDRVAKALRATRPTGYDLFYAIDYMLKELGKGRDAVKAAEDYVDKLVDSCKKIGEYGERLIKNGMKILTHCNAGALATVDYGTALAPIRRAHSKGKKIFVFVAETRPRLQGLLTSWELLNEDIPHTIIADNAVGYFMERKEIDLVFVGADRIAMNGDVANKIGTYEKAVLAKENKIPFYVCAPLSTFDFSVKVGKQIKIEERSEDEVLKFCGRRVAPNFARARNPAFDLTPAKYIKGYITERGMVANLQKAQHRSSDSFHGVYLKGCRADSFS